MKKVLFSFLSVTFSVFFLFQSFVAMAEEDPYEPPEMFCGYRVLGHDMQGLPILSSEDYESYFNACVQEKIFSQSSGGMDSPSYEGQPQADTPVAASAFDGLFETLTKLTKLIPPVDFSSSLGLHIGDFFGLDTSLHLGIGGSDTTEPSGGETEPQKNPSEIIISENLYSIGKKRIYYTAADTWEDIQCVVSIQPDRSYGSLSFARSGFGASSTFAIEIGNDDNDNVRVDWGSSGYTVASISGTLYSRGSSSHISNRRVTMRAFSINSLPITETSSKTLLSDTNYQIIGTMQQTSQCIYAESVFTTNSREYNANHYLIWNSGDYFEDFSVYLPDILTFSGGDVSFSGGDTVINNNNVNNYNNYGYYDDGDGGIAFDPDIFAAYIDKLLDHLIELYMQFYNQFPLPDEDIDDPDIQYVVPWELPDFDPGGDTQPDSSGGGGMIQNFSIDYNEVVSPSELYGVLDSETYYLVELDTSRKSLELPSIPDVGDLPEEISGGISALGDFYQSLLTASGFLPVFSILVIVVFFVRLLRR